MSYREVEETLARFSYKPGSKFQLLDYNEWSGASFRLLMPVTDSYNPSIKRDLQNVWQVSPYLLEDRKYFDMSVKALVLDLEKHEMYEWLRKDGVLVKDPHKI